MIDKPYGFIEPSMSYGDYTTYNQSFPRSVWIIDHQGCKQYPVIELQNVYREGQDWYYSKCIGLNEFFEHTIKVTKTTIAIHFNEPVAGRILLHYP